MLEGTPWGAHRHFPLVLGSNLGPMGQISYFNCLERKVWTPELWFLFDIKHEIRPGGSKIDTDSRGLSPKATGLHLVGVGGDTLGSTLALPASWAEVGLERRTPELWFLFDKIHEIRPGGPKFDTDSRGLCPKATGLHLVGVGGDTLRSTLALPASWAEVEGSIGGPQNFGFYSI